MRTPDDRLSTQWEPRFAPPALCAAAVMAVITLALAYPAFSGHFLAGMISDQYKAGYAFRHFAATSLRQGAGIPQWDPYLMGGVPNIAAMSGDIFYPTLLLRLVLPTDQAITWGLALHVFLAGMFTYVFLRAWGLGFLPALTGGVAYMISGQVASLVSPGHDGKLFVSALFPLALWALVRGVRDGRSWAWGALAAVVGLAVLSPHPQLLQYLLLASGAFALYLAFGESEAHARLERGVAIRRLGLALAAVAVGAMIGAVQFLPVREYVPYSPRAGGRDYDYATSFSMPWEELLINTYLPQFTGILERYWGRNGIHLHSEYLGAVVLMLAGAGLRADRRSFRWYWIGTFVVSALWALGGNTPFYHVVYAIVPGSHYFRAPSTIFYVTTFAVAVLAALGVERVLARRVGVRYAVGWSVAAALVALLAMSGALTNLAQTIAAGYAGGQLDDFIASNAGVVSLGGLRSLFFVALAAAVLVALDRRKLSPVAAAWTLLVLAAVDLYSVEKQYWNFSRPASQLYGADPAISYLESHADSGRVIAFELAAGANPDDPFIGHGGQVNGLMAHRIRSVFGYHGNELGRYQHLLGRAEGAAGWDMQTVLATVFSPAFWRHENVRYLYTNADDETLARLLGPLQLPVPPRRLFGPVKNAAGTTVYLYQLPGDNPLAWIAPLFTKAPDEQARATVLDRRFDPSRIAIADTATPLDAQPITALPASINVPVEVAHYDAGRIRLRLATPLATSAALVVSENYFPGWRASADGRPLKLGRADYNLIGVSLPAGTRAVDLVFEDAAYERGRAITWLAVALAVLAIAGGVVLDRRRVTPAAA